MVQFDRGSGVELRSIITPSVNVGTGQAFEVVFDLYNHNSVIIGDPDGCQNANTPCNGVDGYCIRVVAQVGGVQKEMTSCLNLPETGIPPNNEKWSMTLPAPDSAGDYDVTAYAETTATGNRSSSVSSTVVVSNERSDVENGDGSDGGSIGGGIVGGSQDRSGVLNYVINNPGKSVVIGGGAAFVADRTIKHLL
jgi:hypothetical protein